MSSITVTGIDENIRKLLKKEADKDGVSISEKVRQIITENLKINKSNDSDFSEFLGLWNENEYLEFKKNTEDMNSINEIDWK